MTASEKRCGSDSTNMFKNAEQQGGAANTGDQRHDRDDDLVPEPLRVVAEGQEQVGQEPGDDEHAQQADQSAAGLEPDGLLRISGLPLLRA